ncbi:MAG: fasciclin [Flavobacteriaceae bacterium CG2_30_34_30]|nr:fasciclin domain-containing protein [Flavobacteriia bacterium]OIP48915.1 MAG: fasciclin [Flavobacteriaceae bacterium CG2_30_34_30]PIQ17213.1 MAG: fasciclin [Flavobacteriaceae bacterium CG18_big_fil_WC_8_21_14_2_50_34_36]PIV48621.1 MAG: fasciclin [Flavobacteriaceae bacterium CG02_land_8_20_14_3_00_34_13]PIZ07775.1 MAG: fasciclin [Flavobacteriaceae bacterium CG_4_10_14_0_8_um_filter_34_31]PJC07183.1 MAG: fasciclin [Flavobacteriaceae bacterium CG_4_9_14_0_8_um_filter_34_30]
MKLKKIVLSLAVIALLFASCDDSKKKEAEAQAAAQAELVKAEEEAALQAEEAAKVQAQYEATTIAAIAMSNENFSTLVSALVAADLATTMKSEGPYTVFAPTNEAFSKLPKGALDNLLKPENKEKLAALLTYHVVSGEFKAADVMKAIQDNKNSYEVVTLQGEKLTLSLKDDKVMIKDAKGGVATVVMADVDASNGVIHAIDKVVMPKA